MYEYFSTFMAKKAMFVSITQLKLKSLLKFPKFMVMNFKVVKQLKDAPGLIKQDMRATNPYTYWTLTVWDSKESMLKFRNNGAHLDAMKNISTVAKKTKAGSWQSDAVPGWKEAMQNIDIHPSPH